MGFFDYLATNWDHVLELAIGHAIVVAISLAIDVVIGVALGVLVYRRERAANVALSITSIFLTIPLTLALFGLLIPLPLVGGLGYKPAIVALAMYGLLPILRNTVTGLRSVDPAITESAQGMGMSQRERLLRIELPLAWPVIIAGVRVSTMLLMGIAAIAAVVNGPGLGDDIFAGLARIGGANALNLVLGGTLGIVVLAILFDSFFGLLSRLTTSRGIRD